MVKRFFFFNIEDIFIYQIFPKQHPLLVLMYSIKNGQNSLFFMNKLKELSRCLSFIFLQNDVISWLIKHVHICFPRLRFYYCGAAVVHLRNLKFIV